VLPQRLVQSIVDLIKIGLPDKQIRNWLEASEPEYPVSEQTLANIRARVTQVYQQI